MLGFLSSLAFPVIPVENQRECLMASSNHEACLTAISKLSDVHLNTFIYLMKFLREVLKHKDKNQCSTKHLCKETFNSNSQSIVVIFSNTILRPKQKQTKESNKQREEFITQFMRKELDPLFEM